MLRGYYIHMAFYFSRDQIVCRYMVSKTFVSFGHTHEYIPIFCRMALGTSAGPSGCSPSGIRGFATDQGSDRQNWS